MQITLHKVIRLVTYWSVMDTSGHW